jgi:hypothetical protein
MAILAMLGHGQDARGTPAQSDGMVFQLVLSSALRSKVDSTGGRVTAAAHDLV